MGSFTIRSDYPGGNIKVVEVSKEVVRVEQEIRDTMEWWFYWNFCVEGDYRGRIKFVFTNGEVLGPWGPAVSHDGITWEWLGSNSLESRSAFSYYFTGQDKVYFSFSLPYQVKHFEAFYNRYKDHPMLQRDSLTVSEQGRLVPLLRLGNPDAQRHIIFTCRHHACESTASYLLEGLLSYWLDQKQPPVLRSYLVHVVPFVDIDGVENGDQGKSRRPHDHNRDYTDKPMYKSISAIMEYAKDLNIEAAIDFHSPWKWGGRNDYPFFVKRLPPVKEEIEELGKALAVITANNKTSDHIVYDPQYDIEQGEEWNQDTPTTSSSFFERLGARLSCGFEFPYFGTGDVKYTQANSRLFGMDFAKVLEKYLMPKDA